jgi:uncharacterized protein (DUF924 family)
MNAKSAAILQEWFGELDADGLASPEKTKRWFLRDAAFDALLTERYGADVEAALGGALDSWDADLHSAVARVLLLDQFTRNIFRGTARMFAGDPAALLLSQKLLAEPAHTTLPLLYQAFVCMPLMHAENLEAQDRCIREFERLRDGSPPRLFDYFKNALDFAQRHRFIIEKFGRFPHRNAALGRESSEEEAAFLLTPGSSF